MTDEQASVHAAAIHARLLDAEKHHPNSRPLVLLHAAMAEAWTAFHAARPGVIQPFSGTDKPPPKP